MKKIILILLLATTAEAAVLKSTATRISIQSSTTPPTSLPQGVTGLASKYTGDVGLGADTGVIFFDDFESYTNINNMIGAGRWDSGYNLSNTRIATESNNFYAGSKGFELTLPKMNGELSIEIFKEQNLPKQDTVFVRFYSKFDLGFNVVGSGHNGVFVGSNYWRGRCEATNSCGPGKKADGTNKFLISYEAAQTGSVAQPGSIAAYTYHPEQRGDSPTGPFWGDLFYPTGRVAPYDRTPYAAFDGTYSNLSTYIPFVSRPEIVPQLGRWYCFEIMVKANTPGLRDGRIAFWLDGNIIADFTNLRLRDIADLKIDHVGISMHGNGGILATSKKYYDNFVIAKSYIGPMKR